ELVTWPGGKKLLPKTGIPDDPLIKLSPGTFAHLAAARSNGPSGSLMLFNVPSPREFFSEDRPKRSQIELIVAARREGSTWIDAREACGWDIPVLVAHGMLDSVELANGDLGRKAIVAAKSTGRPRDGRLYPGPAGNARWNEAIYYHLLNCGLHIPPTAGSGSGTLSNPLGYNRVYVHLEGELSYQKWFDGLRAGSVVVTNGPLIRPDVEGELPGHVFQASRGEEVELEVGLTLSTRDPISYLEIVKDGQPIEQVRLKEWERLKGKLPLVKFHESGWFLIRAVTDLAETHRFATTGPYYVEIGDRGRISKSSAQFFADWVDERVANIEQNGGYGRESEREFYQQARQFWKQKVAEANAP
ncbi:MAG TPA: CehA/McbA family metallohydrolase, partial [Pirellulales bacterium]